MIKEIKDLAGIVLQLRLRDLFKNRLFKILLIGSTAFLLDMAFFELLGIRFKIYRPSTAALLAAELTIIYNFIMHNLYTFADVRIPISLKMAAKFAQFNVLVAISLFLQWFFVFIGEQIVPDNHIALRLFNILGILIGFIFNYHGYTRIIWPTSNKT